MLKIAGNHSPHPLNLFQAMHDMNQMDIKNSAENVADELMDMEKPQYPVVKEFKGLIQQYAVLQIILGNAFEEGRGTDIETKKHIKDAKAVITKYISTHPEHPEFKALYESTHDYYKTYKEEMRRLGSRANS